MEIRSRARRLAEQPLAWVVAGVLMPPVGAGVALSTDIGLLFWLITLFGAFLSLVGAIALGVSIGTRHAQRN